MPIKRSPINPASDPRDVERFLSGANAGPAAPVPVADTWEVESEPLTQVNLRLPVEMAKKLNFIAKKTGRQKQALVAEALGPWLDDQLKDISQR
jgi:hypothetical protein